MVNKFILTLKNQLEKLDSSDFDFEAWKTSSIIVLTRIFGANDVKIKQLETLRIEYGSSWSMRTVSGSFDPISSAIKQGREIIEVSIKELELYGEEVVSPCGNLIEDSLSDILKVSQYKDLQKIGDEPDLIIRKEELIKFFKKLSKEELTMVLSNIMVQQN